MTATLNRNRSSLATSAVLVTAASGYRLLVVAAELDVSRFERVVAEVRAVLEQAGGERAGSPADYHQSHLSCTPSCDGRASVIRR